MTSLLNDFSALSARLGDAVDRRAWLDAYLLAAGCNQIAEDVAASSPYPFDEVASVMRASPARWARDCGALAARGGSVARALRARQASDRRLRGWQLDLAQLLDELADVVCAGETARPGQPEVLAAQCRSLIDEVGDLPVRLRATLARLPACFHAFDQQPDDLRRLADRYLSTASTTGPLLVVGLRTSGSYLAPLLAGFLRTQGQTEAQALTLRPGHAMARHRRERVAAVQTAGGEVLLIDDPPVTGGSLLAAARELERAGLQRRRIVVTLALLQEALPPRLGAYRTVVLAPEEWSVAGRFGIAAVRTDLGALLADELTIDDVTVRSLPGTESVRGHRRGLYRIRGHDLSRGDERELWVLVTGVGLGYFGAHALTVSRALSTFSPRVFGLQRGLLYREWRAPEDRLDGTEPGFAAGAARYIAARREALPATQDLSLSLRTERPVWEVAGIILADRFGRGAPVARVVGLDAAVRRLLRVRRPSVVDGATEIGRWFSGEGGGEPVLKVGLTDRTHWHLGLDCFDAAFDLAGVAALASDGDLADRVRAAWHEQTGEEVPAERWLLYELVHLWGARKAQPEREAEVRRAGARALQRYFAGVFLAGLMTAPDGPLCALDIDGVLETEMLGWPSLTRASAVALRALIAHGYRPVPVTGRGLHELRDRCQAYGLPGGVAEYGCVLYLSATGQRISLLTEPATAALDRVRASLRNEPEIQLDPAYEHGVRAYRRQRDGGRTALSRDEAAACLDRTASAGEVRFITGEGQTDFVGAEVDKGTGLRALGQALGGEAENVALAVGDTASDGPMLALARASFVPAHAPRELRDGVTERVSKPYQQGFDQAVAATLGHRPGSCSHCRISPPAADRRLLIDLLSIGDGGRGEILADSLRSWARWQRC